jgi:hypothetical protein
MRLELELYNFEPGIMLNVGFNHTNSKGENNYVHHRCIVVSQCDDPNEYDVYEMDNKCIRTISVLSDEIRVLSIPTKVISSNEVKPSAYQKRILFYSYKNSLAATIPFDDITLDDILIESDFTQIWCSTSNNYLRKSLNSDGSIDSESTEIMITVENKYLKNSFLSLNEINEEAIQLSLASCSSETEDGETENYEDYDWELVYVNNSKIKIDLLRHVLGQFIKE